MPLSIWPGAGAIGRVNVFVTWRAQGNCKIFNYNSQKQRFLSQLTSDILTPQFPIMTPNDLICKMEETLQKITDLEVSIFFKIPVHKWFAQYFMYYLEAIFF